MQNTITIQETPFPIKEEIVTGGIELILGISALVLIIVLLVRNIHFQNENELLKQRYSDSKKKYRELYDKSVSDITDLKLSYENKIDKLEEVINNLEKNK